MNMNLPMLAFSVSSGTTIIRSRRPSSSLSAHAGACYTERLSLLGVSTSVNSLDNRRSFNLTHVSFSRSSSFFGRKSLSPTDSVSIVSPIAVLTPPTATAQDKSTLGSGAKPRILVAEPLADDGVKLLKEIGTPDSIYKLSQPDLIKKIAEYEALIVRSGTKVTKEVLEAGKKLKVIGRAGVGVDNIDLETATALGILVVNAPTSNCVAAAEHAIALLLSVARRIPQAHASLQRGEWERQKFVGSALSEKVLGIVGFGRVGSEVARRAKGLGMRVKAYDPFMADERARLLGVEPCTLEALASTSDFVSLHMPLTDSTRHLINKDLLSKIKKGSYIINVARGEIIDDAALIEALDNGTLAGAALDVFSKEPPSPEDPLLHHPKIVVTPHLGASTEEAQVGVALEVCEAVVCSLRGDFSPLGVNAPMVPPEKLAEMKPYIELSRRLAKLAAQLSPGKPCTTIKLTYTGIPATMDTRLLRAAAIRGALEEHLEPLINIVNADLIAKEQGVRIIEESQTDDVFYGRKDQVSIELGGSQWVFGETAGQGVVGTISKGVPQLVSIGDYPLSLELAGKMLLIRQKDAPGSVGAVGTLLGSQNKNISFMSVGRLAPRADAMMAIGIDEDIDATDLAGLKKMSFIIDVAFVSI